MFIQFINEAQKLRLKFIVDIGMRVRARGCEI